jgi:predicted enzyme related to lactoylglutathione lyase
MSRVVHFEIPTTDVEASRDFYGSVFGWKFTKWEGPEDYWLITTGDAGTPGIDGGFYNYQPGGPMSGTINTIDVTNLDEILASVQANGGEVLLPRMIVPGVGYLAYAKDPQGAVFGMMQADLKAGMG